MPDRPDGLPSGPFAGRLQFQQGLREGLDAAGRQGWGELIVADADFADWPLGERAVVDALQAWARPGRRFTMLATGYDTVRRLHPRFVQWRVRWDHLIACHACPGVQAQDFPSALWTPGWALRRLDVARCKGWAGDDAARRVQVRQALADWQRRSFPSFAASVLGL